jgi:hypothetical protein
MEYFDFQILSLIYKKGPIKAKYIAYILSNDSGEIITRKDVNSSIYSNLLPFVRQDNYFRWFVEEKVADALDKLQDVKAQADDSINYDSIVTVKYSTGETKKFGFKGGGTSEMEKMDDVEYINFYAPLPQAVLGKNIGDLVFLNSKISVTIIAIE